MALGFGTSGLRGLVTELTDRECAFYTLAFARYLQDRGKPVTISLAGDARSSTPRISRAVAWAIQRAGGVVDYCGGLPTPALAFHAFQRGQPSIMVTGSHIPDDRNGIKFNLPAGEILKADEAEIAARYTRLKGEAETDDSLAGVFGADDRFWMESPPQLGAPDPQAAAAYLRRYLDFFPVRCFAGRTLVLYEHSSVARELLGKLLEGLGARVQRVGRSDRFIPLDTEAVENAGQLADWVATHRADALVSADGDGDRPLLVDERGDIVRGDVMGILTAAYLRADFVAAPVSCNTALEQCGLFPRIRRTRIGSSHVAAELEQAVKTGARRVVGYEANGGFLLGSEIAGAAPGARLLPLPTRDAALPILAVLHAAAQRTLSVSKLVRTLPARFTHSALLRPFPNARGRALVAELEAGGTALAERVFGTAFGGVARLDFSDGARMTFVSGDIVHVRPSGNAPEFRVYTEAETAGRAAANAARALEIVQAMADN